MSGLCAGELLIGTEALINKRYFCLFVIIDKPLDGRTDIVYVVRLKLPKWWYHYFINEATALLMKYKMYCSLLLRHPPFFIIIKMPAHLHIPHPSVCQSMTFFVSYSSKAYNWLIFRLKSKLMWASSQFITITLRSPSLPQPHQIYMHRKCIVLFTQRHDTHTQQQTRNKN